MFKPINILANGYNTRTSHPIYFNSRFRKLLFGYELINKNGFRTVYLTSECEYFFCIFIKLYLYL